MDFDTFKERFLWVSIGLAYLSYIVQILIYVPNKHQGLIFLVGILSFLLLIIVMLEPAIIIIHNVIYSLAVIPNISLGNEVSNYLIYLVFFIPFYICMIYPLLSITLLPNMDTKLESYFKKKTKPKNTF